MPWTFSTAKKPHSRWRNKTPGEGELPIGRIAGAFGVRGEMKCDPTASGRNLITAGAELRCERDGIRFALRLTEVRPHKGRLLIRAENVGDANAAKALAGTILYAQRNRLDVGPEEYLDADLVGCRVVGMDGREYGAVGAVEHYPASDMLVVAGTLVPMVSAIVRDVDLAAGRIVIDPPAGLFE